jgi:hypothetical protein
MIDGHAQHGVIVFHAGWRAAFICDGVIEVAEPSSPPSYHVAFPVVADAVASEEICAHHFASLVARPHPTLPDHRR